MSSEVPELWLEIEDTTASPEPTVQPTQSSPRPSATLPAQGMSGDTANIGSASTTSTSSGYSSVSSSASSGGTTSSSGTTSSGSQRPNTGTSSSSSSSSGRSMQNTPRPTQTVTPTQNVDQPGSFGQSTVTPSTPTPSPESSPNYGTELPIEPTATIPEESLLPSNGLFGEPDTDFKRGTTSHGRQATGDKLINSAAVLLPQFGCFQVVAPAASTAFGLGRRRSHSSAAPALALVFPLASAAGLCLRQTHAGISGLRCRGRRSGAFLHVQLCRPCPASLRVQPLCSFGPRRTLRSASACLVPCC